MRLRRLDLDATWLLADGGSGLLVDPWLVGSEVDGFGWFNEQWHATPAVSPGAVDGYDAIVVTQGYTDHCHRATLEALREVPILATPRAEARLRRELPGRAVERLPRIVDGSPARVGPLAIAFLDPGRRMDPVYYALWVQGPGGTVLLAPHGFRPTDAQRAAMGPVDGLITCCSTFRLPAWLGGEVSPGLDAAAALADAVGARVVLATHDEDKPARGIVKRLARTRYPDEAAIRARLGHRFVALGLDPEGWRLDAAPPTG